jgi:ferredoxin
MFMKGRPGLTVKTGAGDQSGVPVINEALCSKCGHCVKVCKTFTLLDSGKGIVPRVEPDNGLGCIACGQCMAVCPRGAVTVSGRGISPADAVKLQPKNKMATPESLQALLLSRRSVREFSKKDISMDVINKVIEIASSAPMGIPPSDVGITVINGRGKVQEIAGDITSVFNGWIKFFNPVVMKFAGLFFNKYEKESFDTFLIPAMSFMVDSRKTDTDLLFYHAPCVMLFHQSPYADPVDGQIACTYAMIAAQSLGLGTCMIGTVSFAINREKKIKNKWKIPADNKVALALILGYPALQYQKSIKRKFASVDFI